MQPVADAAEETRMAGEVNEKHGERKQEYNFMTQDFTTTNNNKNCFLFSPSKKVKSCSLNHSGEKKVSSFSKNDSFSVSNFSNTTDFYANKKRDPGRNSLASQLDKVYEDVVFKCINVIHGCTFSGTLDEIHHHFPSFCTFLPNHVCIYAECLNADESHRQSVSSSKLVEHFVLTHNSFNVRFSEDYGNLISIQWEVPDNVSGTCMFKVQIVILLFKYIIQT